MQILLYVPCRCVSACLSVCLSVCMSECQYGCLSVFLSVCLPVSQSVSLCILSVIVSSSVYLCLFLCQRFFACFFVSLSANFIVSLPVHLYLCLSVCLLFRLSLCLSRHCNCQADPQVGKSVKISSVARPIFINFTSSKLNFVKVFSYILKLLMKNLFKHNSNIYLSTICQSVDKHLFLFLCHESL